MNENQDKRQLNVADVITLLRIFGTLLLFFFTPLTKSFLFLYALTGLTDVLDGWIARKTKTASDFGARLDSIADLIFYAVILVRILPILVSTLPSEIWYVVAAVLCIRISAYITAAIKYRRFASLHTYLNKCAGFAVFLIPFSLVTGHAVPFCWTVAALTAVSSLEELIIHLRNKDYSPAEKSIFIRKK